MEFNNLIREDLKHKHAGASNLKFNEKIKQLQSEGRSIYHLGFGQSPFPIPQFAQDELKKYAHVGEYLPVAGLPELREAICKLHKKHDCLENISCDDVVVSPGSKELIYQMMNIINGDVILLAPTWTTYKPQAGLAQKKVLLVNTTFESGWKLTPEVLDEAIQSEGLKEGSMIVLCNPDNPTGATYTADDFVLLSKAFRKHKLLVLSDEIYSRLSYNNDHVSIAKFYPEGTILSSGISKWASCGGWRLGYLVFPPNMKQLRQVLIGASSQTYTTASAPIQYASIQLLRFDERGQSYARHCSRILNAVCKYSCNKLREVGVKVHNAGSGYYIFPDFEVIRPALNKLHINTGEEMCEKILKETSVALMPGGPHYLHSIEALTVRLCYVNFNGIKAIQESEAVGMDGQLPDDFINIYCKPTIEAIDKICEWVKKLVNV